MRKILTFLTLLAFMTTAWSAGTVTHLAGTLSVKRGDGSVRLLSLKSEVIKGDTLQTEKDSYAQIKFTDGGVITLKPNTQMLVQDYKFDAQKPADDGLAFNLVKGGLRAVTGLVGKRGNQDAYKMTTGTATIGIRGTTYDADDCKTTLCRKLDSEEPGSSSSGGAGGKGDGEFHEPGVYVSVRDGEVLVSNSAGSISLAAGQFGFVAASNIKPAVLPGDPGISTIPTTSLLETVTSRGRQGNLCE